MLTHEADGGCDVEEEKHSADDGQNEDRVSGGTRTFSSFVLSFVVGSEGLSVVTVGGSTVVVVIVIIAAAEGGVGLDVVGVQGIVGHGVLWNVAGKFFIEVCANINDLPLVN